MPKNVQKFQPAMHLSSRLMFVLKIGLYFALVGPRFPIAVDDRVSISETPLEKIPSANCSVRPHVEGIRIENSSDVQIWNTTISGVEEGIVVKNSVRVTAKDTKIVKPKDR